MSQLKGRDGTNDIDLWEWTSDTQHAICWQQNGGSRNMSVEYCIESMLSIWLPNLSHVEASIVYGWMGVAA